MKSWIKSALLGAFFIASIVAPARGDVTIHTDVGGNVAEYVQKYIWLDNTGETVRIAGDCMSACTLMLGILDRNHICAERNAVMSFHSATEKPDNVYSPGGTDFMRRIYPRDVQRVIARHGWDLRSPHPKLIPISGKELHTIVRPCAD